MRMRDFCEKLGLFIGMQGIEDGTNRFIAEMEEGLAGRGSLKMLPAYIDPLEKPDYTQKVIVVDAGGTNLRIALVSFSGTAQPHIDYFENYPMLGTKGAISAPEFFDQMAAHIAPVADKADKIGLCFSFPAQILPSKDAKILQFTKEVKVSGAEGLLVGDGICRALKARGFQGDKAVTVINDTVAALLGGVATTRGQAYDGFIGIILGTGTNTCYIEQNAHVLKDPALAATKGQTIINLESGGYACAPRTAIDEAFDAGTDLPGDQMFEKMISGAYAGALFLDYMKAAASSGCFSAAFAGHIAALNDLTGRQIDDFCAAPFSGNTLADMIGGSEPDRDALYALADAFYDRIAAFITINLAALLKKAGRGRKPYLPVCISAEGTTFYKARLFRPKLDYYMARYVRETLGYHYAFVKAEDATILGTAAAGLLG
ncbi:MAG: hexokinase [Oscillospiraceae bacterium]|jgi:hexokinase|nr:hexokinase [Oscillospiraceae bacterium]